VVNRRRWVLNLIVIGSVITLAGFSFLPVATAIFDGGAATAADNNSLSTERVTQIQSEITGYNQVLQREPENLAALKGLLDARLQLGDIKGSVAPLQKVASLNPQNFGYTILLAQTKQYLGDREGAASDYRSVLIAQPQQIEALQGLVSLLIDAKRPAAAIGVVQAALDRSTATATNGSTVDTSSIKLLMAQIYVAQQRNADALAIYDELIKISPADFRPVLSKALVYKQLGNLTAAQSLMKAAAALAPSDYKDRVLQMASAIEIPKSTNNLPAKSK
jgi:tetratricopeptide (TPR) repeat protein